MLNKDDIAPNNDLPKLVLRGLRAMFWVFSKVGRYYMSFDFSFRASVYFGEFLVDFCYFLGVF